MSSVGIRELRQRASELLRRVEAGETIEVTDRGRPVALLAPVPAAQGLRRLRADGDTSGPKDTLDSLPRPIELPPGAVAPSRVLSRLRQDER
jgi:prevent-host-death family protein